MPYDPFGRGRYPVGVRSTEVAAGARRLPVEVWYPAEDAYAGQDLDAATCDGYELIPGFPRQPQQAVRDARPRDGRWPLIAFSHGYGGHRRQSTFLCSHLASHGYVVVAPDHVGNTVLDAMNAMAHGKHPRPLDVLREFVGHRPADIGVMLDRLLDGDAAGRLCDPTRIGMSGHSFGGWTTLVTSRRETRIGAALALAPAGGSPDIGTDVLHAALAGTPPRAVPTLLVVADRDTLLPLRGMQEIHASNGAPKRMVVMRDTDHMHFCDNVERVHELFRMMPVEPLFAEIAKRIPPMAELSPGEHAHDVVRGLGLAHFDATLKGDETAAALLGADVVSLMASRGVRVDVS